MNNADQQYAKERRLDKTTELLPYRSFKLALQFEPKLANPPRLLRVSLPCATSKGSVWHD